jgi:phosphoesterase RecJ-like protein
VCAISADDSFDRLRTRLAGSRRLLIVTHARPDPDGLGASAALATCARTSGRLAAVLVPGEVPPRYAFLFPDGLPAGPDRFAELADAADLVVILDTCAFSQLDDLAEAIAARREKVVVADHHVTSDEVGSVRWIDSTAAAAGVMTLELIEALGWPMPDAAAEALLAAIAGDTGWFRFSNTDGRALRAAGRLADAGVRADVLYAKLYQADRPQRLRLLERALASLELHCGGRLALMRIRRADFELTGGRPDETENFVNEPLRIAAVEASVMLVDSTDTVRVSLRSRGGIDVSAVAGLFGGGGHVRAAGCRIAQPIDAVAEQVVAACAEALASA